MQDEFSQLRHQHQTSNNFARSATAPRTYYHFSEIKNRKLQIQKESKTMVLTLTDTAASEVKKFLEAENVGTEGGLRVRVVPGGCSGFQYAMNVEETPQANDEVVESSGLRVFVDMFSAQYLDNVQIDYVNSVMGSGFTFNNPNATGGCGCGSSFTA
jgi:iron-sulfur cluster assembly accessory protein